MGLRTITITIRPDQERLILRRSRRVLTERALEVLRSEEAWFHDNRGEIGAKIERAFEQFERGDFSDG